jgi:hypothetical protein
VRLLLFSRVVTCRPVAHYASGLAALRTLFYACFALLTRRCEHAVLLPALLSPAVACCGLLWPAADLDLMLRCRGIRNIILAGVTTDV